jgi:hypothetical protein
MANHYYNGAEVRCEGTFTDADGVAQDPTAVFFKVKDPGGNLTSYEYGVDAELVKSATGIYYADVDIDEAGIWPYRFYATGTGQSAEEAFFRVEAGQF